MSEILTLGTCSGPAGLKVEHLHGLDQVRALEPEWRALTASAAPVSIFSGWDWVASWFEHFRPSAKLFILTVRDSEGRLVGLAPLSFSQLGPLKLRVLYLLGAGHALTEYVDAVLHRDVAEPAAAAIVDALYDLQDHWDLVGMSYVEAGGPLARAVCRLGPARGGRVFVDQHASVRRPLPDTWQTFYGSLSKSMKDNVNNYLNRLRRDGHREELVVMEKPAEIDAALDGFFDLHRRRSQSPGRHGHYDKFAPSVCRRFLRTVVRRLAERGQVWVCFLHVDGRPVAVQLCLVDCGRLYLYYSGFDPDWWRYGVMLTLTRRCIERAMERGIGHLDLMAGAVQEKLRWGGEAVPLVDLMLTNPRWRSRATFAVFRAYKARRASGTTRILTAPGEAVIAPPGARPGTNGPPR